MKYFPQIYPDEIVYSVVARYMARTGRTDARYLCEELFQLRRAHISIDLPTGLKAFAEYICHSRAITADDVVTEHTLYNYYCAFTSLEYRKKLASKIAFPRDIADNTVAWRKSIIDVPSKLRFCPECRTEMIGKFGEAYWRREHQIPLVLICTTHETILVDSHLSATYGFKKFATLNMETPAIKASKERQAAIIVNKNHLMRIASVCASLSRELLPVQKPGIQREIYYENLRQKGLGIKNRAVDRSALMTEANKHFEGLRELWPRLFLIEKEGFTTWIETPLRTGAVNAHPNHHVLLQDFIKERPDPPLDDCRVDFWRNRSIQWPCFNPIAHHKTPPKVLIDHYYKKKDYSGARFVCECGYSYTRRKYHDGRFHQHRLSCFGPTIVPFLQNALKNHWSIKRMAEALRIRHVQVIKEAARYGIVVNADTVRGKGQ